MKTHLFGTWLLANFIHPVFFSISFLLQGEQGLSSIKPEIIVAFLYLGILSSLLSVPSLIICLPFGDWMNKTKLSTDAVFGTWLLFSPLIVLLNLIIILFFASGGKISMDILLFGVPGMVAAISASLLRYKSFFKTMSSIKNHNNETTLV